MSSKILNPYVEIKMSIGLTKEQQQLCNRYQINKDSIINKPLTVNDVPIGIIINSTQLQQRRFITCDIILWTRFIDKFNNQNFGISFVVENNMLNIISVDANNETLFTSEELNHIKTAMENQIKKVLEDVHEYGWNDEATAGADDCLDVAHSIVNIVNKFIK